MAVQIHWHGGVEPPDQDNLFGKSRPLVTYTGTEENEDAVVEVAEGEQAEPECQSARISSEDLGAMIARASERLAQDQRVRRPVEESTRQANNGENPNKQQKGQVVSSKTQAVNASQMAVSNNAKALGVTYGSDDELYSLAQGRMTARAEEPLVVESSLQQRQLVMMSRAVRGSVVVEIDTDELSRPEPKPAPTIVQFPLSEERQRAEDFYRQTGMKVEDFRDLFAPGWTVAEMISPRENARRMRIFFYDRVCDAELAKLKIAKAVHEFLHKKRSYRANTQQAQLD